MSTASFDEENQLVRHTGSLPAESSGSMSGWLVRKGLAANQTSADLTLFVLAATIVLVSGLVYFRSSNRPQDPDASAFSRMQVPHFAR
jgi:hypothetical protein